MGRARSWRFLCLAALLILAACHQRPRLVGTDLTGVPWGGDFTLTGTNGRPFDTAALRGRVVLIYFGYTRCTDVCQPTLHRLADLMHRLGPDARRTRVVFVTVDPSHDTPDVMRRFLAHIDPGFIGLTGSLQAVQRVEAQFKVASERQPSAAPSERYLHSDGIYVEDPSGHLRLYVRGTARLRDLAGDVRSLLAAG
ncbi:MAG: SCO family protein [Acidiferrobacteraceae bacterium]